MALLDFPTGPNTNDTTTQNGNTWKWNGTSWVAFNNLSLSSQVSGILAVQYGGTGFGGTYTAGDILYALSSNTFGKLAAGTAGSVLASGGPSTAPYWKLDEAGSGSVGNGNTGGFAYYTNVNNVTSGTAFSYISGTNNVILTNGTLSLTGSTVNSGTWAGNAISLVYGGTNNNLSGIGQSYQLAFYNATGTAITALTTGSGIANSILFQANNSSAPIWVGQSQLSVGTASSSVLLNTTTDTSSTLYLLGSRSSTGFAGTAIYVDSNISVVGNTLTGNVTGTATTATRALNTDITGDTTSQIFLTGSRSSSSIGSTPTYVLSGVSALGNTVTATTFVGALTGTASIASSSILLNTTTDTSSTLYLLGSRSSTGFAGTAIFVDTNLSFVGNTITGNLTGTATTATRALNTDITGDTTSTIYLTGSRSSSSIGSTPVYVLSGVSALGNTITATTFSGSATALNTTSDTSSTLYLLGTRTNGGFAGTAIYVDNNISVVGNTITANLTGTATTATRALNTDITGDTTSTIYLTGSRSSSSIGSTPTYVLSGVSALGNTITATTFKGSLSGIATTSTTAVNLNTYSLSGTMYLTGQTLSSGVATGSSQFVGSGISFNSVSGLLTATSYAGSGILLSGIVTSLAASTGISVNSATGAVTVTNTGVISLTGTANQVLVGGGSGSATSGNITLTLPQSIATASSPSFADITLTTGSNSTLATVGSQPTSMVNKQYVDNLAAGLDIHESMRVLQASALSANYVQTQGAGSAATSAYLISTTQVALPAIDGVTISATGASQRVLVVGGFTGTASIAGTTAFTPANSFIGNGSYFVVALGGLGTSNWILRRTTDADDNVELNGGTFTFIEEGTSYSDSGWVCSNDTLNLGSIQFGSTPITFTQFTGGGAIGVGQGLTKVGNTVATKVNLFSTGTASGTGFTQFNIGGAGSAGVADTGYYPTFTVRTSGTVAGTAVLTLNSDGFSLVGSTNNNRTITVTGSDITLTGGGNTLTLTGSISLPSPTQYGIAYGSSSTAVSFLTAAGSGASVLTQTLNNNPVYLGQSQLSVGTATSSASVVTDAVTATRFLIGTVLNSASSGGTVLSTGSGITIGNNLLTSAGIAVTGSTASTSTTTGALVVSGGVGIGGSLWTNGSTVSSISGVTHQNGAITGGTWAGTAVSLTYGGTNANLTASAGAVVYSTSTAFALSAVGTAGSILQSANTGAPIWVGQATLSVGTATSSASVVTDAVTATRYLIGTVLNSASTGGTVLSTGSGITIGSNLLTSGGIAVTNTTASTSSTTGALIVSGGAGIAKTSYFGQSVVIQGSTASTTSTTGALTVSGGVGIGGSLSVGSYILLDNAYGSVTTTPFASIFAKAIGSNATSLMQVKGNDGTVGMGIKALTGSNSLIYSNGQIDFSVGSTIRDNDVPTGGTTHMTLGTTGILTLSASIASGSTTTGALVVTGGVGIGGSLWTSATNYSSISGLAISNGVVLSGVWAGTAVSLAKGGTNASLTASAGAIVYSTSTAFALSAVGTAGSILQSANTGAPIWVGQSSLSVGLATSTSNKINVSTFTGAGTSYLYFGDVVSGYASIGATADITVVASTGTINAKFFSGIATSSTRVGITTSVSSSDLPIVFADTHQPYAALGSSTLLTYQASTGKITNGIWAGTAITTRGGGTGFNTVNANQVLIGAATGNTWAAIASTNLPVAAISTTPPTQPGGAIGGTQPGQLWWDSEYGVLKVYYNDGNTSQWVDATPVLGSSGGGSSTKRSYVMTFGAGFTPSTGADTVQILIPYAPDNTAKYYFIKRLDYRANTPGTGVSFYIERFTGGNAAFDVSSGNRIHSASGASFVAASGIFITSYTQSSSGASFVSSSGIAGSILSGDYLRLNYSHINSAATMSVSIIIEEQ